ANKLGRGRAEWRERSRSRKGGRPSRSQRITRVLITVAGGILERLVDRQEFPTIGKGLWFALQTVTTVGYGDVTPKHSDGRFIGAVVMLTGIGFLAVITASVTASLIESSRRRFVESEGDVARRMEEVSKR